MLLLVVISTTSIWIGSLASAKLFPGSRLDTDRLEVIDTGGRSGEDVVIEVGDVAVAVAVVVAAATAAADNVVKAGDDEARSGDIETEALDSDRT
jgi:hypothetical protein